MGATVLVLCSTLLILQFLNAAMSVSSHNRRPEESETKNTTDALSQRKKLSTKSGSNSRLTPINFRFIRRPRKKQSDPERLLELLGNFFDPKWMSIEEPNSKDVTYATKMESWQYKELAINFNELNVTQELTHLSPSGETFSENSDTLMLLKNWLLKKASCPIKYSWEDAGILFWPRWIKQGECANKRGTCSWPPGMHCVPSGSDTLQVLRWQCRLPKSKGRRKRPFKTETRKGWRKTSENDQSSLKCQWFRVPYPIVNECMCTC